VKRPLYYWQSARAHIRKLSVMCVTVPEPSNCVSQGHLLTHSGMTIGLPKRSANKVCHAVILSLPDSWRTCLNIFPV